MKHIIYTIFLISLLISCEGKEPEVNDPAWRIESLKIADSMCNIFRKCSADSFKPLKPELKNFAVSRMFPANCIENHKKSRVYLLKGYPPEIIKANATDCFAQMQKMTCEQIKNHALDKTPSCVIMNQIQLKK